MSAITDAMRLALHNRARTVLGREEGDTLMAHLPPVGWADVATKQDVDNVRAATKKDIENLASSTKQDIENLAASTRNHVENLRLAMKADMERGFRRQTVWFAGILLAQQASFMYMLERFG